MADTVALLADATQVWAKAQIVRDEPSWQGKSEARAFVEKVAAVPACHDALLKLLSSPKQLVVAHALQTLELMGSPVLADLAEELCSRREQVTFQCGSFRTSMDLGGYARQVRKRTRQRVPERQ